MKKHVYLFLILTIIITAATAVHISAWSGGPQPVGFGATSDDGGYEPSMAFDDSADSFWHSKWSGDGYTAIDDFPQSMIVELDSVYTIDCVGYLARHDSSPNGTALAVEVWVSTTGSADDTATDEGWTKVAEGSWDDAFWTEWKLTRDETGENAFQNLEFEPTEAKLVKLKVLDGVGGWASCAALEIGFLGVDYLPMSGFEPKSAPGTPVPTPAPATVAEITETDNTNINTDAPAVSQSIDGTAIVTFSIIFLTAACLIAYGIIFGKSGGKQK
jgi:F5/8 type C domain.